MFKPFNQIPVWNSSEKFEISGMELEIMRDLCNAYDKFVPMMEEVIKRSMNQGSITIKYEDMEGKEIPKEEVQEMYDSWKQEMSLQEPNL